MPQLTAPPQPVQAAPKAKRCFIEVLRIIACFLVIVNHTLRGHAVSNPQEGLWWASIAYFFVCKPAVPLFVMISGYTLLDKQDSPRKWLERILRIGVVLVLVSAAFYVYQYCIGQRVYIGVGDFIYTIYKTHVTTALWYLYFYLGILVMLPFLQRFAAALGRAELQLFILLTLFFGSVYPVLIHYLPIFRWSDEFRAELFSSTVGMLLLGYYFKKYARRSRGALWCAAGLWAACFAFNLVMTGWEYRATDGLAYLFLDDRTFAPIVLMGAALFYILWYFDCSGPLAPALSAVGGATFGIYLFSDLFIDLLGRVLFGGAAKPGAATVLLQLLVFGAGFVLTWLLQRIPLVKKFL